MIHKKTLFWVLMFLLVSMVSLAPSMAYAKSKKPISITAKPTNWKKAPQIKVGKKYRVKAKFTLFREEYIKFTAKKTGKYKVSISNFVPETDDIHGRTCTISISKKHSRNHLKAVQVKTKGGKSHTINLADQIFLRGHDQKDKAKASRYRLSRSGIIKLKKGETIYLGVFCPGVDCTVDTVIKKVK